MEHFYQNFRSSNAFPWEQGELFKIILEGSPTDSPLHIVETNIKEGGKTAVINVELINHGLSGYTYHAICDKSDGITNEFVTRSNLSPIIERIRIITNDSLSQSQTYPDDSLDVVYLNLEDDYLDSLKNLEMWYPKLKSGGYITGDDFHTGKPHCYMAILDFFNRKPVNQVGILQQWWMVKP